MTIQHRLPCIIHVLLALVGASHLGFASPIYATAGAYVHADATFNLTQIEYDPAQPWDAAKISTGSAGFATARANNDGPGFDSLHRGGQGWASATANLSEASLRAMSFASLGPGASASSYRSQAIAAFGDQFVIASAGNQGPFTWTSNSKVRFDLSVSGYLDPQGQWPDYSLYFAYGLPGALAKTTLPGQFTPTQGVGFLIEDRCFFQGTNHLNITGLANCGGTISRDPSGLVSGNVFAEFAPGGDFDWLVRLSVSSWPGSFGSGPGYSFADFSNTVTVAYQGPPDSITYSGSGAFPRTFTRSAPIPEPASFGMALFGLAVIGCWRKRSHIGAWSFLRKRTVKGILVCLYAGVLTATGTAQSFFESNSDAERCSAIRRWEEDISTRINSRLPGSVKGMYVAGYRDAIGKPFSALSRRELKSVLSALRSCSKDKDVAMSFLITMFDFKSRNVQSRDLELWTEALAQAEADTNGPRAGAVLMDASEREEIRGRLAFAKQVISEAQGKDAPLAREAADLLATLQKLGRALAEANIVKSPDAALLTAEHEALMIAHRSLSRQHSWMRFLAAQAADVTPNLHRLDPSGNAYACRVDEYGASNTRARAIELVTSAMKRGADLTETHRRALAAQARAQEILDQEWQSYRKVTSVLSNPTKSEIAHQEAQDLQRRHAEMQQMSSERERRKAKDMAHAKREFVAGAAIAGMAALIFLAGRNGSSAGGSGEDAGAKFIREICGDGAMLGYCR
jgi:hypothetical protein